jgi:uncharacterized protein (TIGR04255 family)
MTIPTIVAIDFSETFPHLSKAPIVEAVIDLRARAEVEWEESSISERLKPSLPDYPKRHSLSGFQQRVVLGPGVTPEGRTIDTGWTGLRFQTEDGLQVAQFNRNGFIFSRLRPYEEWDRLIREAMRLWALFADAAKATEVQRLGLRFINRIDLPSGPVRIEDYLEPSPQGPRDLNVTYQSFFHHDMFAVPGHSYAINLVRTTQPGPASQAGSFGLILDIDVFTTETCAPAMETIERRLTEMRWLKNKVFFGSVASKALESFK